MKKLLMAIPLVFLLCITFACQDKEAMAELEEFKAQAALEEQNIALVKRHYEAMNNADIEGIQELYAPDLVYYNPTAGEKQLSLDEVIEHVKRVFKAMPDISWSVQDIIAKGDMVIARNILKGTLKEDWQGVPAGKGFEITEIVISRIQDGKTAEQWIEIDALGMMQQLGFELKPKEGEK
jgi:steroid delta-isomerase-like uncharacterized protein